MVWVLKDGAAGPSLARLQFGIELAILLWGLRVWLRCTTKWRSSLRRVNAVVQVYFLIYIADAGERPARVRAVRTLLVSGSSG